MKADHGLFIGLRVPLFFNHGGGYSGKGPVSSLPFSFRGARKQ
jgi:hypothetical protein